MQPVSVFVSWALRRDPGHGRGRGLCPDLGVGNPRGLVFGCKVTIILKRGPVGPIRALGIGCKAAINSKGYLIQ